MKKLFIAILLPFLISSCATQYFYQMYKATPSDNTILKENQLIYEDTNCKVSYNLWDEGGNIGFRFFNKTDQNIYLNLGESFFVINGESYNYFKNRVYTNSTSTASTATAGKSYTGINYLDLLQTNNVSSTSTRNLGYSVSYNEERIICIPSKTTKTISEYSINNNLFRDCDLLKYPNNKKQIHTMYYKKTDSPFVFGNRLAYSVGNSENQIKFENEFFASEITNYPKSDIIDHKNEEFCKEKSSLYFDFFKMISPDMFYIKYKKDQYSMKH